LGLAIDLEDKKGKSPDRYHGPGIFVLGMFCTWEGSDLEGRERRTITMRAWTCFVLALVVWVISKFVFAQEAPKDSGAEVTMGEVVVTGTRYEERVEKIPANVTIIDEIAIKNSNAVSVPDLLRSEEGIVVRDPLGNGRTAAVDLRGFGETGPYNTLVLVDGRRVNEIDLSGVDWTQIPISQIERIEILRGAGSVLYGDMAVGGVINIITKTPSKTPAFSAAGSLGSYNMKKGLFSLGGGEGKVAASVYGNYDSTDGYRQNNDYLARDLGGKAILDATDSLRFTLSGSYHKDHYGLPGALTLAQVNANPRASESPFDTAKTEDGYVKLGLDLDLGDYGNILSDFSYKSRGSDTNWISSNFVEDSMIHTWAITPRYVLKADIFKHRNTLIGGIDLDSSTEGATSFFGTPPSPSGHADIGRKTYGVYLSDEYSILERLTLSLGGRVEHADYDLHEKDLTGFLAPLDATVKEDENAYSAGLTWLYSGKSSLFARVNRSFRFPLTDELVVFDYVAGTIRVNSNLQPQTGQDYELGIRHFLTSKLEVDLTLYRADINHEIYFNRLTFANENYEKTLHQGIEVGSKAELFDRLTLFGNYTYEQATFEGGPFDGNTIPAVPRNKFNLGFHVHDVIPGFIFSAVYNYVDSSYLISDQANEFPKLENYYTLDLRLSYAWKRINAFVGVNNVTDQKYSEYGVVGEQPPGTAPQPFFYPSPERNWLAGIEVAF
jgi:iron complex outermembrane receptor protein